MTQRLHQPWMKAPATRRLIEALRASGAEVWFVGGCVRNALLGEPVVDIDIATQDEPDTVVRLLEAARLQAVPTGIAHGTVTAIVDGRPFEVTSLRRDVSTDGRRAIVAFTRDMAEDAKRRDFTINAIYAAPDGTLADPVGGLADIAARRVRFIGAPAARIAEDYLRILRFFRIHAWYGKGALDRDGLAACAAAADGLLKLSAERIQKELLKLLEASEPVAVLRPMASVNVLARILPEVTSFEHLARLIEIEEALKQPPDAMLRLAAFVVVNESGAVQLAERLKLSGRDRDRLVNAAQPVPQIPDEKDLRRFLYARGQTAGSDALLLAFAQSDAAVEDAAWRARIAAAQAWKKPSFPIAGRDIVAAGIPEGPEVGRILGALEAWWIDSDFRPDRKALLRRLPGLIG